MNPGRNAPCLCGSGKKHKHCCGAPGAKDAPVSANPAAAFNAALRRRLGERTFDSPEALQAFLEREQARYNQTPLADFHGLSPGEMQALLHAPFDSPGVAAFRAVPGDAAAAAPIVRLFLFIAAETAEKGVKATAQGNLPRALCRAAYEAHPAAHRPKFTRGALDIFTETDFFPLHVARITAEAAGFLKLRKGVFTLTAEGRKAATEPARTFDVLARGFVTRYDWAYADAMSPLPFVQRSFLFTLYLLHRHGHAWQTGATYAGWFLTAFPAVLGEASPRFGSAEDEVRHAYALRALRRFAVFLGLAEERDGAGWSAEAHEFRATPLLAEWVVFRGAR